MPKNRQNLVLLMDPSEEDYDISLKGGNMALNRLSIDEDAAFELSGVHYLKKSSRNILSSLSKEFELVRKSKGKGFLGLQ